MNYKEDIKSIVIPRKSNDNFVGKNLKDLFEAIYHKSDIRTRFIKTPSLWIK